MANNSLVKNSIYNVLYKLLNALFPLISASYTAHILLADGIGRVASAQNVVQYFIIIAALGIPNYGIREIAKLKNEEQLTSKLFSELFLYNFISTIICTVAYYVLIFSVGKFKEDIALYCIVGISIVLNIFNVDWFYQGKEEFAYIAKRSFVVKILSLIALLLFVKTADDYKIYALIHVIATAGNYLFNVYNLNKYNVKLVCSELNLKKHTKPIFVLLSTAIAVELYTLLDTTMLTFFCDENSVGYYTNSMKIVKMIIIVITAIGGVLLPRLSFHKKQGQFDKCNNIVNKVLSVMLFLFLPCGIGIILTADNLVPLLFGVSFYPAIKTIRIAAFLIYALGFSNLFGTQILLTFNCERKLFFSTIIGAFSNIVMNAIFIPLWNQNGAAIASVISEAIVTIVTFSFSLKYIRYSLNLRFVITSIISTLIMMLCILLEKQYIENPLICLIINVISGVFVYFIINFFTKNPILNELRSIVKREEKHEV